MSTTIHMKEKELERLSESFSIDSETEGLFSNGGDMNFSGVRTVHTTQIQTYPLGQYDRTKEFGTGSRYGRTHEVGDTVMTYEMKDEVSFSLSIDKGNNADQFNMKSAGRVMEAQRKERVVPYLDAYRLRKFSENAGIHYELTAALDKTNIISTLLDAHNMMLEYGVPGNIVLAIKRQYIPTLKLAKEWTDLDSLAGKTLPSGTLGDLDGMSVKPITSKNMPAKVVALLVYPEANIAPRKIRDVKMHNSPPGLSGDLIEFRMYHDAFVLGNKAYGVLVICETGSVTPAPTVSVSGGKATITCTNAGAKIFYTTNGFDPRFSDDAKEYTAAVTLASGDELRCYAKAEGLFWSNVTEHNEA